MYVHTEHCFYNYIVHSLIFNIIIIGIMIILLSAFLVKIKSKYIKMYFFMKLSAF